MDVILAEHHVGRQAHCPKIETSKIKHDMKIKYCIEKTTDMLFRYYEEDIFCYIYNDGEGLLDSDGYWGFRDFEDFKELFTEISEEQYPKMKSFKRFDL